jgi:uncharacterized repeat protein (TIGR01451 family)
LLRTLLNDGCTMKDPDPPPPPKRNPAGSAVANRIKSDDPNDKLTIGHGREGFVGPGTKLVYTIRFENKTNATAAAQRVEVTDPLDPNLDWSTFELISVGFNQVELPIPPGLDHYATNAVVATDPNNIVTVHAALDPVSGLATWIIESIDPITQEPPEDPWAGFLPPNDPQHRGEGYVSYSVLPRASLANSGLITNQARIVFDVNPAILTPPVTNVVDTAAPSSTVLTLPETSPAAFAVQWRGVDNQNGCGIASYDIYVSRDGGLYAPWLAGVTNLSATYTGEVGSAYRFFSVARDRVGNLEAAPSSPDAGTLIRSEGGAGYRAWIATFNLPAEMRDPDDDPDLDGLVNLVEYALALDPRKDDADLGMPLLMRIVENGKTYLGIRHRQPKPAPEDLVYTVTYSQTVSPWSHFGGVAEVQMVLDQGDHLEVVLRTLVPILPNAKGFFWLTVQAQ